MYQYDRKGRLIEGIHQKWDYSKKKWVNFDKTISEYNEEGELYMEIVYQWDFSLNQWIETNKFLYSDLTPEEQDKEHP